MGLKIKTDSPDWEEIMEILHRFAEHSDFCGKCSPKHGARCVTGEEILRELAKFKDVQVTDC